MTQEIAPILADSLQVHDCYTQGNEAFIVWVKSQSLNVVFDRVTFSVAGKKILATKRLLCDSVGEQD